MGKTYKSHSDIDYFDDLFDDDSGVDFEDDLDQYLDEQSHGLTKRTKGRGRRKSVGYSDDFEQYRLPRDLQDFIQYSDAHLQDD